MQSSLETSNEAEKITEFKEIQFDDLAESEERPDSKLLESKSSDRLSEDKADDRQEMKIAEEKTEEITEWETGGLQSHDKALMDDAKRSRRTLIAAAIQQQ